TMGIVALALVAGTDQGLLDNLPESLHFLRISKASGSLEIPAWIKLLCAVVMAAGTAAGGWRIIKTLGHKMVRLQPVHGFAAETSSATIIGLASYFGIPVSTTHNISSSIMGVGAAKRWGALNWTIVERMVWAWLFTIPVSALLAYWFVWLLQLAGMIAIPAK
ncbi:MAG: anion permease, partial [Planctomycetota bacterium]